MAKYYSGITTGTTLDSMLASGSEFGIFPSQDIDCASINATGIHTVGGFFYPNGGIKDKDGDIGNPGQILSSTGSGIDWIDAGGGGATTINNNADNRIITGSATVNTLNAESSLSYDGTKLNLGNDKKITFGNNLRMEIYTDGSTNYIKSATDGSGAFPISIHSGSNERLRITSAGRVGINTTSDTMDGVGGNLNIANTNFNNYTVINLSRNTTSDRSQIRFSNPNGNVGSIDTSVSDLIIRSAGALRFDTNSNERLRIDSGGQIIFQPMTTSERNALSAQAGGVIYNSDDNKLQVYNGSGWVNLH